MRHSACGSRPWSLVVAVAVVLAVHVTRGRPELSARSERRIRRDTYCNRYSAYWNAGTDDCGNGNLDEEWCADFAAWVWEQAGALVDYQLAPGYLNADSASFYV